MLIFHVHYSTSMGIRRKRTQKCSFIPVLSKSFLLFCLFVFQPLACTNAEVGSTVILKKISSAIFS